MARSTDNTTGTALEMSQQEEKIVKFSLNFTKVKSIVSNRIKKAIYNLHC